ncbi:MAG: hypothetical protein KKH01_02655 [Firmicutes bacterium]|nr:hypothetical protein [Bacillota bacterium]
MKTGLNAPFYKWIDDVKKAIRHKRELEEKLEYYQSRLTGYQAVVYDSIGSSSSRNNVEDNLLFIIGKIDAIEHKLKESEMIINKYKLFKVRLKDKEILLLEYLVGTELDKSMLALKLSVTKSGLYSILSMVIRKYIDLSTTK